MARGKKTEKELQEKKERALALIEGLKKGYPDSGCSLIYEKDQAWKLLVSVRLAAQCTDARVNVVVEDLYQKYRCTCRCTGGGDRASGTSLRIGKQQSQRYQCLYENAAGCISLSGAGYHGGAVKTPRCGKKKRQPCTGGCVWEACHRDGHPLHQAGESHGLGGRHQGTKKSGNGLVEADPAGRKQRFLSQTGGTWSGGLHGTDETPL